MSITSLNNKKQNQNHFGTDINPVVETPFIFQKINPFLSHSDMSSLELVNKNVKSIVATQINPHKDPIITDGYGDFVLLDSEGPVDRETFAKAFEHMDALLPQVDQTPRSNRLQILNEKLKEIKPSLKAIFIPRTLYELYYILSANKESMDISSVAKIGCKQENPTDICWHSYSFRKPWKDKYPVTPEVLELAFRLNQAIVRELTPTDQGLTEGQCIKAGLTVLKKERQMKQECIQLNKQGIEGRIGTPPIDPDGIKQAISLECSPRARDAIILYRGSKFVQEPLFTVNGRLPEEEDKTISSGPRAPIPYSVSLGISLFAGVMHDMGACAGGRMMQNSTKRSYAICIPLKNDWKDLFLIPPVTTINGLNGNGEQFHARAKCVSNPVTRARCAVDPDESIANIESYQSGDVLNPKIRGQLFSPLKIDAYQEKMDKYQSARVLFNTRDDT